MDHHINRFFYLPLCHTKINVIFIVIVTSNANMRVFAFTLIVAELPHLLFFTLNINI